MCPLSQRSANEVSTPREAVAPPVRRTRADRVLARRNRSRRTRLLRSLGIYSGRGGRRARRARRVAMLARLLRRNRCNPRARAWITDLFIDHPGSEEMLIGFLAAHRV